MMNCDDINGLLGSKNNKKPTIICIPWIQLQNNKNIFASVIYFRLTGNFDGHLRSERLLLIMIVSCNGIGHAKK